MAWVTGALFLFISVLFIPMFLLAPFPEDEEGTPPKWLLLCIPIIYPLFGALWAWVCGQIVARVYNFVALKKGGVTFEAARIEGAQS